MELKYFKSEEERAKPSSPERHLTGDDALLCGSLYETIEPKPGVGMKEKKRSKKNRNAPT